MQDIIRPVAVACGVLFDVTAKTLLELGAVLQATASVDALDSLQLLLSLSYTVRFHGT